MIIYEFTTWTFRKDSFNGLFTVNEIEVEEKPKTYIGKNCRINKSEIGILSTSYGNRMYLLENKPEIYINAMINRRKMGVATAENRLAEAKEQLVKWEELARKEQV